MVEGRDHLSGDSFIMTGTEDHREPDLYLTWDPVIHDDQRRADQDFIAHARHDLPDMAAEIHRLRELLALLPTESSASSGADGLPATGGSAASVYVVQAETRGGGVELGAFRSMREAVRSRPWTKLRRRNRLLTGWSTSSRSTDGPRTTVMVDERQYWRTMTLPRPYRPAGHPKGHFSVPREGELRVAYRRARIAATQNRRSGSIQRHTGNIPTTGAAGRPRRTPPKHHE